MLSSTTLVIAFPATIRLQTDLAPHSQAELNEVARQLSQRPSKNARLLITGGETYRVCCVDRLNSPQNAAI